MKRSAELFPSVPFDPAAYPRTYGFSLGWRIFFAVSGTAFAIAGLAVIYFGTGHEADGPNDRIIATTMALAFIVLGAYMLWCGTRWKLILRSDAIEVHNLTSTRELRREDVAGYRILPTQYMSLLELVPQGRDQRKLKFGLTVKQDSVFHAWFTGIPNQDQIELAKAEAEILADLEVGTSPEERQVRLAKAKRIGRALNWIAGVAAVWGWFIPRPYEVVIAVLVALPLVAILVATRGGGLYHVGGRRNDPRVSLGLPFIAPALVLAFRASLDTDLVEWKPILVAASVAGLAFGFLILSADRSLRANPWALLILLPFPFAYAYGAITQADVLLDRSRPETHEVTVVGKRVSTDSDNTSYYLKVSQWGPRKEPSEVTVSRLFYDSVEAGQTVCVFVYPGALKFPWYFVSSCR